MRTIGKSKRKQAIVMSAEEATLLLAMLAVRDVKQLPPPTEQHDKPTPSGKHSKTCRLCQRPHSHHNSFCSAECCREHRTRSRRNPERP